jgi:hypothetical protein
MKFLLVYMKSLPIQKIHLVTLFMKLVPAFRKPPVTLKVVFEPPMNLIIIPQAGYDMYTGKIDQ